ncbi:MAG: SUMF1/EgtB/PvdO family nonheme iron enzyme, partial [Bacteroidetes bacterium]|nr:SUMF1/EgtB/PvdO family nonheme iron enzyme [Bacteroidota bacterium]
PTTTEIDGVNHYMNITFDMSWDNSWRDANNFDAAWIFVKYKKNSDSLWRHAYISTNAANHTVTNNNGVPASFYVGKTNIAATDRGMGVFAYRTNNGTGSNNWDGMKLRWYFNENGLTETDTIQVKVFAIEMCYVPQGPHFVGDGTIILADIKGQLHDAASVATPFQILNENALTLGGVVAGNLGNNNATGMNPVDDFNNTTTQILPATFPKGYNAFFCQKYEVSQEEYVGFLNSLTRYQQSKRTYTNTNSGTSIVINKFVLVNSATPLYRNGIRCDGNIDPFLPINFYSDLNNNGIINEIDDGQNIPVNMILWSEVTAYFDWAGIRPMSELEFSKACRGTVAPVLGEGAWGNTTMNKITGILNSGKENEVSLNTPTNISTQSAFATGPVKCGIFATAISNRIESGSSYYGVMELSGNEAERTVSIGSAAGRIFDGVHGDGMLSLITGYGDVSNWPDNSTTLGTGQLGGSYLGVATNVNWRLSVRTGVNNASIIRVSGFGMRGVRTAP